MELPKRYNIKEVEKKWQLFWENEGIYKFDPYDVKREIFSVDTPPPTVSGKMHLGHAFSYTQQDIIVRFQRMLGKNVFYPFGTDDNGLATERLIEAKTGIKATQIGREKFIKLCLDMLEKKLRPQYVKDWKSLGISCDWSIFYTTIDEHCRRISQLSFIELYEKGREYRKRTPFFWCPECQTAIAQVEMKDKQKKSKFVYMKFDTTINEPIVIATTRPELMPACIGVYVHPQDKRYRKFIGAEAIIPFFNRKVKIKANKDVDMDFGSGVVYHCTFGDMDDVEWMLQEGIEPIEILNKDGTLNQNAGVYKGLTVKEAREAIIRDLKKAGRIVKIEPIEHIVNIHERCGTEIEILMTEQWFIRYLDLKDKFLGLGKKLKWFPEHMRHRYDNWIKGLKWDWCISRQRYFGVPFPVWYCKKCNEVILAKKEDLPVDPLKDKPPVKKCPKCGCKEFEPEKDVLDTWATSSLTPQIAIELLKGKPTYKKLFPMSLRPQAHDIITFWLFNTVVKSFLHLNSLPWRNVAISGFVLDPKGKKMSKSKGNVIEPQQIIKEHGVDALRFWAAGCKLGDDMPYQEKDVITGKKLITKLWNAFRFSYQHLKDYKPEEPKQIKTIDKWILTKLTRLIELSTTYFLNYEYSKAKLETEKFFWHTFCDNYLEIIKDRLYHPSKYNIEAIKSAQYTLYQVLLTIIKLFAPIMPHITEEIYQNYYVKHEKTKSIHISEWPSLRIIERNAEKLGDLAIEIIGYVRKKKSEKNLSLKAEVKLLEISAPIEEKDFNKIREEIISTTNAKKVEFKKGKKEFKIII